MRAISAVNPGIIGASNDLLTSGFLEHNLSINRASIRCSIPLCGAARITFIQVWPPTMTAEAL